MVTRLGTILGTALGTELGDGFAGPAPPTIASLSPLHRYRASQAATSGGNVVSVPNEGSGGGQLNVNAGTLVAPAADAQLNNALSVAFTGTQQLLSSLPASAWKLLHDGTTITAYLVGVSTGSLGVFAGTYATAATVGGRITFSASSSSYQCAAGGSVTTLTASGAGQVNTNVGHISRALVGSALTPDCTLFRNGAQVQTANYTTGPSAADPGSTLSVGRYPASSFTNGRWAEFLLFDRALNASELAAVDAEFFTTYGVHA